MGLQDHLAKARSRVQATVTREAIVEESGEKVSVVLTKLLGSEWIGLTATHAPRLSVLLDQHVGYNLDAAMADYPADKITVDGDPVTADEWREWYDLLDSPWRGVITAEAFALHQTEPALKLVELGKASPQPTRKKRS